MIIAFQLLKIGKFTAMIILHFHLQPQYRYELFHINFTDLQFKRMRKLTSGEQNGKAKLPLNTVQIIAKGP